MSTHAHLHAVEQVHGVDLQRQRAIAAEADIALEHGVQLARAGTDNHVAQRIAILARRRKRKRCDVEEFIDRRIAQRDRLAG